FAWLLCCSVGLTFAVTIANSNDGSSVSRAIMIMSMCLCHTRYQRPEVPGIFLWVLFGKVTALLWNVRLGTEKEGL
ncbi:hypothetical protein, partial [Xylella fastidiosa]|uniref:hypothetical protein n=1 Tax=Xylella fastidiosa TaxID=2371 RepID=UPI000B02C6BB